MVPGQPSVLCRARGSRSARDGGRGRPGVSFRTVRCLRRVRVRLRLTAACQFSFFDTGFTRLPSTRLEPHLPCLMNTKTVTRTIGLANNASVFQLAHTQCHWPVRRVY